MQIFQELSFQFIHLLQTLSPALDGVMNFFTFMGRIEFYLVVVPLIYWAMDTALGFRTLIVLLSIDIVGSTLKLVFHQPRPYWIGNVKVLGEETSYGIPSTHSSDSLAVWGYMAYRVRKSWFWIITIVAIVMIALSRLYLGVHFLQDVLFGWLIGGIVLWLFIRYEGRVADWMTKNTLLVQIGAGFLFSLVMILVSLVVNWTIKDIPDPQVWSAYAAHARGYAYALSEAGTFFGAITGYILMKRYAHFSSRGRWSMRLGRYLLGVLGVIVIYFGLDILFGLITTDETILGYILRYIRYGSVGLWVTFVAPWIFIKTKLADLAKESSI
jgi:membrane-associated phospholipid phosphatase